jgi:hypothetical protein
MQFVFAIHAVYMTILIISMQANLFDTDYDFIRQAMFSIIVIPVLA